MNLAMMIKFAAWLAVLGGFVLLAGDFGSKIAGKAATARP